MTQPVPDFVIRGVPRQEDINLVTGWHRQGLFYGPTSILDEVYVHAGFLAGFFSPHPPHCHEHEELHIALSDHVEILSRDAGSGVEKSVLADKGALLYLDARVAHTMRNRAADPVDYFHVRWKNTSRTFSSGIRKAFEYSPRKGSRGFKRTTGEGTETVEIYSGPTRYLPGLRVLFTKVLAGGRIPLHHHPHEVIFLFLSGSVEILGKRMDAPGFAFTGRQMPHYVFNHGPAPAEYYALELHPEA
ncbi:hypothetical protein [Desulfatiglans anilini]|uniref:hypothetical protein n=1 Tax=Desulfatiglans anilini TaxID=90728 RepID=UPI000481D5F9|nr:hypothetical protein [Desulfatiglans anilini]